VEEVIMGENEDMVWPLFCPFLRTCQFIGSQEKQREATQHLFIEIYRRRDTRVLIICTEIFFIGKIYICYVI